MLVLFAFLFPDNEFVRDQYYVQVNYSVISLISLSIAAAPWLGLRLRGRRGMKIGVVLVVLALAALSLTTLLQLDFNDDGLSWFIATGLARSMIAYTALLLVSSWLALRSRWARVSISE